ncbi:MAG: DUF484 family protein [Gammaproteobacteria bacterium]|nr:DUF484 family protein [Gammaproteobacteria bacterium]
MSTDRQTKPLIEELDDARVIEFLRTQPDFFERHPQLLAFIKLKHVAGDDGTVSLIERQVSVLRDQNQNLELKLLELVNIARDNERVSQQLHLFAAELLKVRTLSDIVAVAEDEIRKLFDTEFVSLRLLPALTDDPSLQLDHKTHKELFREMTEQDKPLCGRLRLEQLQFLFRGNAKAIASAAAVSLKAAEPLGVLGLGSSNVDTFNPTMGHVFLQQLADLLSSAITAHHG